MPYLIKGNLIMNILSVSTYLSLMNHKVYTKIHIHICASYYNMTWNCNFANHHLSRQYECHIFFSYQVINKRSPVYIKSDYTIWMRELYILEIQVWNGRSQAKSFQTSINYLSKPVAHGTLVKIKAESCVSC